MGMTFQRLALLVCGFKLWGLDFLCLDVRKSMCS